MYVMDYKYVCVKCNYGTNLKSSMDKHNNTMLHKTGKRKIRKDKQRDKYKCDKCEFESITKSNYELHKLNYHSTIEDRKKGFKFYCEKCNFGTFGNSYYKKHMVSHKHLNKTM